MPHAEFLENYGLYRKFPTPIAPNLGKISKPRINMRCKLCLQTRTFSMTNSFIDYFENEQTKTADRIKMANYLCLSCEKFERTFVIKFDEELRWMMKIGQYPEVDIPLDANIEKMLGERSHYLRKAMVSENHGYGIGAFSYYRRIVEEIIDQLLADIESLIPDDERDQYTKALDEVKKTRVTSEKIVLVKDMLPPILRPNNLNPLSILHNKLSEGVHAETDEDCLESASNLRDILIFLSSQIETTKNTAKNFSQSMRAVLDKKSQPTKQTDP